MEPQATSRDRAAAAAARALAAAEESNEYGGRNNHFINKRQVELGKNASQRPPETRKRQPGTFLFLKSLKKQDPTSDSTETRGTRTHGGPALAVVDPHTDHLGHFDRLCVSHTEISYVVPPTPDTVFTPPGREGLTGGETGAWPLLRECADFTGDSSLRRDTRERSVTDTRKNGRRRTENGNTQSSCT